MRNLNVSIGYHQYWAVAMQKWCKRVTHEVHHPNQQNFCFPLLGCSVVIVGIFLNQQLLEWTDGICG